MTRRELKTDRGIHVRRGVLLFQLLLVPPPCPPSFLRSWRAHSPRAAAAASGGVVLLGARSRGGWYGFRWVLGGQDCPANMRQTVAKTELAVQVRSAPLL